MLTTLIAAQMLCCAPTLSHVAPAHLALLALAQAPANDKPAAPRESEAQRPAGTAPINFLETHKQEYVMPDEPTLLEVGPATYLSIDGTGDPAGEQFQARVGALYGAAYSLKMAEMRQGRDFVVAQLEGLWDVPEESFENAAAPKDDWKWQLLIRVPDTITDERLREVTATFKQSGVETTDLHVIKLDEGRCVQLLHVGPYDQEAADIARMRSFMKEKGYVATGLHHEIYFSDPRTVAPEDLRTILRQPVKPVEK